MDTHSSTGSNPGLGVALSTDYSEQLGPKRTIISADKNALLVESVPTAVLLHVVFSQGFNTSEHSRWYCFLFSFPRG